MSKLSKSIKKIGNVVTNKKFLKTMLIVDLVGLAFITNIDKVATIGLITKAIATGTSFKVFISTPLFFSSEVTFGHLLGLVVAGTPAIVINKHHPVKKNNKSNK